MNVHQKKIMLPAAFSSIFQTYMIGLFMGFETINMYFRWKVIGGGKIIRNPGIVFPNGLPIEISEKDK
jgi:hypothetical protein